MVHRRLLLVLGVLLAFPAPANSATIRVPADQPTIQAGINVANVGDTVLVAPGTYTGLGNKDIDFGGKDLVLRSEVGAQATAIDCEGAGRGFHFHNNESSAAMVSGFTIRNGHLVNAPGAGIVCVLSSSPRIAGCVFSSNEAINGPGGAIFLDDNSRPRVSACTFIGNTSRFGGAIYCANSSPAITGCDFVRNYATYGGGLSLGNSEASIADCLFLENVAFESGGAVACNVSYFPAFVNCTFIGNQAESGGGMWFEFAAPIISRCTLYANSASIGGGVLAVGSVKSLPVAIENSIICFSPLGESVMCRQNSIVTLTCCDIYGNAGGDWVGCIESQAGINGNLFADPLFCDPKGSDLHLCSDSPCAPGQSGACDLIGALPVGCVACGLTAVEPTTWGAVKAQFGQ